MIFKSSLLQQTHPARKAARRSGLAVRESRVDFLFGSEPILHVVTIVTGTLKEEFVGQW